jgi:hypothetical protein
MEYFGTLVPRLSLAAGVLLLIVIAAFLWIVGLRFEGFDK